MRNQICILSLVLLAAGCGRDVTDVGVKMVGVGYNPDEIGPSPTPYGGIIEYNWVDFAGAGLSLAFTGLVSFESVPSIPQYKPPYAMVASTAIFYDAMMTGAGNAGVVLEAPPADDVCYTTIEPSGPMGFADTVDVGSGLRFVNADGTGGFNVERIPADYPSDPQDVFVYYSSIAAWKSHPLTGYTPGSGDTFQSMEPRVLSPANYPHGQEMIMQFPGAVVPAYAPVSSIPFPSSKVGDPAFTLPNRQGGLRMSWNGPKYDETGAVASTADGQATCMSYYWPAETPPSDLQACVDGIEISGSRNGLPGQIYTGPWDTTGTTPEEQQVKFEWATPAEDVGEVVTLSIRFLGPIDFEKDQYIREYMVNYDNPDDVPNGRAALPCEQGEKEVPASYYGPDGAIIPSLRGDPFHTVAEVTCRLADDGEYTLSAATLAKALEAARAAGAEGAVFLFDRSTQTAAELPRAKDYYDHLKDNSPILLRANSVEIGRFWLN